eukprot:365104-Chlamydomonas_euryale.AAC.16
MWPSTTDPTLLRVSANAFSIACTAGSGATCLAYRVAADADACVQYLRTSGACSSSADDAADATPCATCTPDTAAFWNISTSGFVSPFCSPVLAALISDAAEDAVRTPSDTVAENKPAMSSSRADFSAELSAEVSSTT